MKKLSLTRILRLDPESELSYVAAAFLDYIKDHIHEIIKEPTNQKCENIQELISELYEEFYKHAHKSLMGKKIGFEKIEDHPEAEELKEKAKNVREGYEKLIVDFAKCYLHIHQSMGIVHEALSLIPAQKTTNRKIEWTQDTDRIVAQYSKDRDLLQKDIEQLSACLDLFAEFEPVIEEFEASVENFVGPKEKDAALRSVRSALRQVNFVKARKALDDILTKKGRFGLSNAKGVLATIKKSGEAYIQMLFEHQEELKNSEGKLLLNAQELRVIVDFKMLDLNKKHAFITKYFRSYLEYRLKSTHLLKDKLLVVGSPDSLLGLYTRMMHGMILPMVEIKDIRVYEAHVIDNINFLLNTQFTEVKNIDKWNADNMEHFYANLESFEISKVYELEEKEKVDS